MNNTSLSRLIVPVVTLFGALWLALDILTAGGNSLGKVYYYVLIVSAIFGLLSPKGAFFYLVALTAYLDYFKRLMILDAGMSYRDLYYVLGAAPATVCGIMASVCYSVLQGKVQLARGQGKWTAAILFGVVVLTTATVIAASGGRGRAVGDAVNTFIYAVLLLIVPVLFPTPESLERMLRKVLYIFIPSALYMLYHGFAGITSWEMAYVKSGFTIEIRQLGDLIFRPFGTMSSAASASAVLSIFAVVAVYGPWGKRGEDSQPAGSYGGLMRSLGFLLFAVAAACTYTRTGWVSAFIALGAAVVFRFRAMTIAFYTFSVSFVVFLIFSAGTLIQNKTLFKLSDFLTGGDEKGVRNMALRVTTFTERLQSFQNLLENPKLWTPLGWRLSGRSESQKPGVVHDAISDALLQYGYIPVGFAVILAVWSIRKMHQTIAGSRSPLELRLNTVSAGCLIGSLAGCFSVWSQIRLFPVNFYLWLFPSVIFSIAMHRRRQVAAGDPLPDQEREAVPGGAGDRRSRIPSRMPV